MEQIKNHFKNLKKLVIDVRVGGGPEILAMDTKDIFDVLLNLHIEVMKLRNFCELWVGILSVNLYITFWTGNSNLEVEWEEEVGKDETNRTGLDFKFNDDYIDSHIYMVINYENKWWVGKWTEPFKLCKATRIHNSWKFLLKFNNLTISTIITKS